VAGLRHLHKADPVGRGYTVVGFGSQCVPQILALALGIRDAAAALNARNAAAAGDGGGGGGAVQWRVGVGVARGSVATGALGATRHRCHFFGGAMAEAVRLARECPAGEARVQRGLTKLEGAHAYAFTHTLAGAPGAGAAVGLTGRRRFSFCGDGQACAAPPMN
jgi:class 3 adenylate cyclase